MDITNRKEERIEDTLKKLKKYHFDEFPLVEGKLTEEGYEYDLTNFLRENDKEELLRLIDLSKALEMERIKNAQQAITEDIMEFLKKEGFDMEIIKKEDIRWNLIKEGLDTSEEDEEQ